MESLGLRAVREARRGDRLHNILYYALIHRFEDLESFLDSLYERPTFLPDLWLNVFVLLQPLLN